MTRNILKSSLQNASFSIIFQILFRIITFILNAFIIRTVGQDVLGIMNVRLLLLESTILFLSKEPIIKACLTDTKNHNWSQVINQIWLSVPLTSVLCVGLVYVWINVLAPCEEQYIAQYKMGCYSMALSCIIEQVTECVVLVAQSFCFVKLKIIFETIYIIFRTTVFVLLVKNDTSHAIDAFSKAQISSAVLLCILYYSFFYFYIPELNCVRKTKENHEKTSVLYRYLFNDMSDFPFTSIYDFFPGIMENPGGKLDKKLCLLSLSFAKQSIVKQILTEGEKYVMTISPVLTFSQQSMYDIVNNLGSLAARFVFRPIEESAYFYFTQMIRRDAAISKQEQTNMSEAAEVLGQLCKIVTSIGLIILIFGQSYSYTLLYMYGGDKLVENYLPVTLLKFHSGAIVLLAVNGVTEGYVFATMNSVQLDRYNYLMVVFSVVFLLISYIFTYIFGAVGFILANCINMIARITHSFIYIQKQYKNTPFKPLEQIRPSVKFTLALILSGIGTTVSETFIAPNSLILHVMIGAIFFLFVILIWCTDNVSLLLLGYDKYKRRVSLKQE